MRWWLRFVLTVVGGPLLWWIASGYVATQGNATVAQWLQDTPRVLPSVYLIYTLPALLVSVILLASERVLAFLSLDLFTVLVSPIVAFAVAWAAVRYVPESHVRAAGSALPLFVCYGLVWGMTIREPRRRGAGDRSDGAFVKALLP